MRQEGSSPYGTYYGGSSTVGSWHLVLLENSGLRVEHGPIRGARQPGYFSIISCEGQIEGSPRHAYSLAFEVHSLAFCSSGKGTLKCRHAVGR